MRNKTRNITTKDGIIGLAIGDAMGVPVEFVSREKLIGNPVTSMIGYGSHKVPKGTYSDDTAMTLATIKSITDKKEIDTSDIANNFLKWMRENKFTATGKVFDIGRTTLQALAKCELKVEKAEEAEGSSEYDNGNGSLMRILPIAYYSFANDLKEEEILNIVKRVSSITHRHEISIMGCYIYVLFAIELLKGKNLKSAYKKIKKTNYSMFSYDCICRYDRILEKDIYSERLENINSKGYIVDTLEATLWVLFKTENFNQAIIGAINLGNDTDTIGACVGGLAGIIYGLDNCNSEWIRDLLNFNYISNLCDEFDKSLNIK